MIDRVYTNVPFNGSHKMVLEVSRILGRVVNRRQVRRLMRWMGIEAVYPKPNLSKPCPGHRVYPYLLGVAVGWVDQV